MGLLDLPPSQDPTTLENKKQRTALAIRNSVQMLFAQMVNNYTQNHTLVWANPDGLTPQEVCDSLGGNATQLFGLASVLVDTVNHAAPGTLTAGVPDGVTVTPNQDGTVKIGTADPAPAALPKPDERAN